MRLLRETPADWQIPNLINQDGNLRVQTGHSLNDCLRMQRNFAGMRVVAVNNIEVEASFSMDGSLFVDVDTDYGYRLSHAGPNAIIKCFIDGTIVKGDGCITGRWTFRKMGQTIFLHPAKIVQVKIAARKARDIVKSKEEEKNALDVSSLL